MVFRGIFKVSKSDHGIAEEKQEVFLDRECAEAFRRLKELLTIAPILKVPNMDVDFLVCIDSSKEGLGGVLMQDG
jgi:hypothetical protein